LWHAERETTTHRGSRAPRRAALLFAALSFPGVAAYGRQRILTPVSFDPPPQNSPPR